MTPPVSRRSLLFGGSASVALALLAGCAPSPPGGGAGGAPGASGTASAAGTTAGARRMLGVGYEDLARGTEHVRALAANLDSVGATDVSVVAGRVDWTTFPWPGRDDAWSSIVRGDDGPVDALADAIEVVAPAADGARRDVTIVLDVLAPRLISDDPSLAGRSASGEASEEFPSLVALTKGAVAAEIVDLVGEIAERYRPRAISLTELFLDDTTFGDDDLDDFRRESGADDWPRVGDEIDLDDDRLADWRCEAVAGLVGRARDAAATHGVELWMEVRAPVSDPSSDRRDSGHDYDRLADAADRLVLWDYFGIDEDSPPTLELATAFTQRLGDRGIVSVGLWDADDDAIGADELRDAAEAAERGGSSCVWVTPVSLMTDEHWSRLGEAWLV